MYRKRKRVEDEEEETEGWRTEENIRGGKRKRGEEDKPEVKKQQEQKSVKAVMFVPYTAYSELAMKLREAVLIFND